MNSSYLEILLLIVQWQKVLRRPFLIISATRCGSTTLDRALSLIPGTWVANQPRFDDVILRARAKSDDLCVTALLHRVEDVLTDHSGIKHVFDPNGHPFQEPWDMPTIQEMERDAPLWHRLNTARLKAIVPGHAFALVWGRIGQARERHG